MPGRMGSSRTRSTSRLPLNGVMLSCIVFLIVAVLVLRLLDIVFKVVDVFFDTLADIMDVAFLCNHLIHACRVQWKVAADMFVLLMSFLFFLQSIRLWTFLVRPNTKFLANCTVRPCTDSFTTTQ